MLQPKKIKRPDTPLAPTPQPRTEPKANLKNIKNPKSKNDNNGGYATGVIISEKDEKAHPEDFKFLKR